MEPIYESSGDLYKGLPGDVLEDLRRETGRRKSRGAQSRKKRRPTRRELDSIVARAVNYYLPDHPLEFTEVVRNLLREEGYDDSAITDKRIWESYERMVRKGWISDRLGVVE